MVDNDMMTWLNSGCSTDMIVVIILRIIVDNDIIMVNDHPSSHETMPYLRLISRHHPIGVGTNNWDRNDRGGNKTCNI